MRRNTRYTTGMVLLLVLALALPVAAAVSHFRGPLTDLDTATSGPFDGAVANATGVVQNGKTLVSMSLRGIDRVVAGTTYGAHVHTGTCVENSGGSAAGHYNAGGGVSADTEVWLDFTVTAAGTAHVTTKVAFEVAAGGAHAVVIHALPTAADGSAGARLACLPLEF